MRVSYGQMVEVTLLAEAAGKKGVKHLSSTERKAVQSMANALENGQKRGDLEIEKFQESDLKDLITHLKHEIGSLHTKKHSNIIMSMLKGTGNIFGRVSSRELSKDVSEAHLALSKIQPNVPEFALKGRLEIIKETVQPIVKNQKILNQHCEKLKDIFLRFFLTMVIVSLYSEKIRPEKQKQVEANFHEKFDLQMKIISQGVISLPQLREIMQKLETAGFPKEPCRDFEKRYREKLQEIAEFVDTSLSKCYSTQELDQTIDSFRLQMETANAMVIHFVKDLVLENKPTPAEKNWLSRLLGI